MGHLCQITNQRLMNTAWKQGVKDIIIHYHQPLLGHPHLDLMPLIQSGYVQTEQCLTQAVKLALEPNGNDKAKRFQLTIKRARFILPIINLLWESYASDFVRYYPAIILSTIRLMR